MNDQSPPLPFDPGSAGPWPFGPMTFGQVLDRIFRLSRRHLRSFIGVAALPIASFFLLYAAMILPLALSGILSHPPAASNSSLAFLLLMFPAMLLVSLILTAVYALYCAAASHAALQADLGLTVGVRAAYAHILPLAGRYIWLMILRSLCVALPILAAAAIIGLGALVAYRAGALHGNPLGMFLLIPLGILFYVAALAWAIVMSLRLSLAIPICVEEELTAGESLRRSGRLTRGVKGRILLVLLVVYAVSYAALMIFVAVFAALAAVGGLLASALHPATPLVVTLIAAVAIVFSAGMFLYMALTYSGYTAAFAVLYHDQRRRELAPPGAPA